MRRRNIIGLVAGLVLISGQPAAPAAPERIRHVVVLFPMPESDPQFGANERLLRAALVKRGWVEGRNLVLTFASVGRDPSQIDPLLPEIPMPEPDVIASRSTAVALALHRRSQRTPVVFTRVADPVGLGLVAKGASHNTLRPHHRESGRDHCWAAGAALSSGVGPAAATAGPRH